MNVASTWLAAATALLRRCLLSASRVAVGLVRAVATTPWDMLTNTRCLLHFYGSGAFLR